MIYNKSYSAFCCETLKLPCEAITSLPGWWGCQDRHVSASLPFLTLFSGSGAHTQQTVFSELRAAPVKLLHRLSTLPLTISGNKTISNYCPDEAASPPAVHQVSLSGNES